MNTPRFSKPMPTMLVAALTLMVLPPVSLADSDVMGPETSGGSPFASKVVIQYGICDGPRQDLPQCKQVVGPINCTIFTEVGCKWDGWPPLVPILPGQNQVTVYTYAPDPMALVNLQLQFLTVWVNTLNIIPKGVTHILATLEETCDGTECVWPPFPELDYTTPDGTISASVYLEGNTLHVELQRQ